MSFNVEPGKEVTKARAYMSACGLYEGALNGEKIGNFCLAPGHTDYRKRVQYQTADITSMIKSGINDLFFMLADGWYRGSVGAWGLKNFYGNETKLLVQIEVYFSDGSKKRLCSNEKFEWTDEGPIRFADNKDGEIYDARYEDLSKASWKPCKVTDNKEKWKRIDDRNYYLQARSPDWVNRQSGHAEDNAGFIVYSMYEWINALIKESNIRYVSELLKTLVDNGIIKSYTV